MEFLTDKAIGQREVFTVHQREIGLRLLLKERIDPMNCGYVRYRAKPGDPGYLHTNIAALQYHHLI